jgi:hypothetical protein
VQTWHGFLAAIGEDNLDILRVVYVPNVGLITKCWGGGVGYSTELPQHPCAAMGNIIDVNFQIMSPPAYIHKTFG